jgi:tetratricopeptide (TPR) repeat protein
MQMPAVNVATVLAPNILRTRDEGTQQQQLQDSLAVNRAVHVMLLHLEQLEDALATSDDDEVDEDTASAHACHTCHDAEPISSYWKHEHSPRNAPPPLRPPPSLQPPPPQRETYDDFVNKMKGAKIAGVEHGESEDGAAGERRGAAGERTGAAGESSLSSEINKCQSSVKNNPHDAAEWEKLAAAYSSSSEWQEAVEAYEHAISLRAAANTENSETYIRVGLIYEVRSNTSRIPRMQDEMTRFMRSALATHALR